MTISEGQQQVDNWIKTYGVRYFNEMTNLAILMEEVGELSRLFSRTYGEQSFKESDKKNNIEDEMADILWVLMCLANQTGVNLEEALKKNIDKKTKRDSTRHLENDKLKDQFVLPKNFDLNHLILKIFQFLKFTIEGILFLKNVFNFAARFQRGNGTIMPNRFN